MITVQPTHMPMMPWYKCHQCGGREDVFTMLGHGKDGRREFCCKQCEQDYTGIYEDEKKENY